MSISIASIAGGVLLLGLNSSLQTTDEALKQTIALGMAQQLMDEVTGCRYVEYGSIAYSTTLQPDGSEAATGTRSLFDDIDDFNGFRSMPPTDPWGVPLGMDDGEGGWRDSRFRISSSWFARWQQEVDVYYVDASNLATRLGSGQTSDYRMVDVRIVDRDPRLGDRILAQLRRVVAYVPPM